MYLQRREINKRALDGRRLAARAGGRRDAQTEGKGTGSDVGRGHTDD